MQCGKSCLQQCDLNKHYLAHSETEFEHQIDKSRLASKTKCLSSNCKEIFYHHTKLISHMKQKHSIDIQSKEIEFSCLDEF